MRGIVIDQDGDLALVDGRMTVEQADGQHLEVLLRANRGEFKELPLIGGEATKMMGGQVDGLWCVALKKQIESVGIAVSRVSMTDDEIIIQQ